MWLFFFPGNEKSALSRKNGWTVPSRHLASQGSGLAACLVGESHACWTHGQVSPAHSKSRRVVGRDEAGGCASRVAAADGTGAAATAAAAGQSAAGPALPTEVSRCPCSITAPASRGVSPTVQNSLERLPKLGTEHCVDHGIERWVEVA